MAVVVYVGGRYVVKKVAKKAIKKAAKKAKEKSKNKGKSVKFSNKQSSKKWVNQYKKRGWNEKLIVNTMRKPYTTRHGVNKHTGNKTKVYYRKDGSHVIVDSKTKKVIQISDRTKPWKQDSSIKNPYKP
ncbi:colicin E5-related ribonuclease [Pseudobacillus badius]|uniref:colicin E5-related ribonuclease n=1 Tax=Bacillus badius TaxID=1455 RepID=UPI0024A09730|nr:colicin E5-related ribonuclease [Bacillus badius]GLY09663.1 hypothetical protein Bbad01_08790 [Bacillus badius]